MRCCGAIRCVHYEELLASQAQRGLLPPLLQSRRLAVEFIENECLAASHASQTTLIALGARRSTYQPLLLNLRVCHQADVVEALMSIPLIADSAASKALDIVDGGFEANTPHHLMPAFQPSLVLSYFKPEGSWPRSFRSLPMQRLLAHGPVRHPYRLLWAWINTTFPHAHDRYTTSWIFPRSPCGLNFYSRSLEQHLAAIRQGVADVEAELLRPAHLLTRDAIRSYSSMETS
jgi:hypothetical protein